MKKIKTMKANNIIISAILILLINFGCSEDFLDRQPLDSVVSSNFYQTEEQAKQALVAIYDALQYQSSPGVSWAPFLTMSDILSDDAYAGGGDANDGQEEDELNRFNISTTNPIVHSLWLKNYTGIYRANIYLENIDGIDASEEFISRTTAEAKFMRAYFHFELARFFENIPLMTFTIKGASEYNQDQETPEETYNQIALDLVESINSLPEDTSDEPGRITKWAAEALLARVYLFYNGVYGRDLQAGEETIGSSAALAYLEDLINNSGHDLLPDYADNFSLAGEFSIESVFEISHGDSPAWWDWNYLRGSEGNLASQLQGPRVTGSDNWDRGWSFATVTQKLFDDLSGDPRREATIVTQTELDGNLTEGYQHTGYFSNKYTSDAEHWGSDGQFEHNRTTNYRVIRYSDVLLMAAELGSGNAQNYLDQVRSRVGLTSVPATFDNIMNERRLELSLEGIRYFDLLRQGIGVADQELSLSAERGPLYIGDQAIFEVDFNPATKGFLPIPQVEVDLSNGTFNQNDGY
ncbi:MAG: RagB/SusD family nutrient uptake outer membrane protein [Cyclobacteriaceae bacterium]